MNEPRYTDAQRVGEKGIASVRTFALVKSETTPEGKVRCTIRITTRDADRTNDRMNPRGIKLHNYEKNPVVLWNHDHSIPAIGKCVALNVTDDFIDAVTEFSMASPLSCEVAQLVTEGYLNTASIGFIPLKKGAEQTVTPDMIASGTAYPNIPTILEWAESELLEYSIVNVPMNQSALVQRNIDAALAKTKNVKADEPAEPSTPPTPEPTLDIPPINPQSEKTMIEEAISQIEATGKTTVGALMEESDNYDNEACDILEALALITVKACKAVAMNTATPEVVKVAGTIQKQLAAALVTLDALTSDAPVPEAEPETTEPEVTDPTELPGEKSVNKAGRAISTERFAEFSGAVADVEAGVARIKAVLKSVSAEPEKSGEIIPLSSIRENFLNSL